MQNNDSDKQDREIQALLKDYPIPEPSTGYFEQALVRATHEGTRRQRNRWMLAGFGSAIAAGAALWMIGSFLLPTADLSTVNPHVFGITMTLEEPRTVNLVFASTEALDAATLTVRLPDGIEISGFPGQREITWQTSLKRGRNLLPLRLIATSPFGGEVYATLVHDDRDRTFRLRVDVS